MNKQIEDLVNEIISIEKKNVRKRFALQSGKGVQYARDKADADAVNDIVNLVDSIIDNNNK